MENTTATFETFKAIALQDKADLQNRDAAIGFIDAMLFNQNVNLLERLEERTDNSPDLPFNNTNGDLAKPIANLDKEAALLLSNTIIPDNISVSNELNSLINNYKTALQNWPTLKKELLHLLHTISGHFSSFPDVISAIHDLSNNLSVKGYLEDLILPVKVLDEKLIAMGNTIHQFEEAITTAYRNNEEALQAELNQTRAEIDKLNETIEHDKRQREDERTSITNQFLGFLTLGTYSKIEDDGWRNTIEHEQNDLNRKIQFLHTIQQTFTSSQDTCKSAANEISQIYTVIQQQTNLLTSEIPETDISNLIVLKARLNTFKKEAESTLQNINKNL